MRHFTFWGFLLLLLTFFASCEPDFQLNADYKDVTIAYGILSPKDSVHYLKIYKAFLTTDNALVEAGKLDNLSYYDSILVTVEEYANANQTSPIKSIPFTMTYDVPKDSGIFAYNPQVVYTSTEKLNENYIYKLKIVNRFTHKTVTATTPLAKNFTLRSNSIPYTEAKFLVGYSPIDVQFYPSQNATLYDTYLKFHYIEVDTTTGDTITPDGLVSWRMKRSYLRSTSNYFTVKCPLYQFFSVIAKNMQAPAPHVVRYIKERQCVDLEIWAAEETFATYLDMFTPSSSVVQDRTDFTNMESDDKSAYGIFSSRNYVRKSFTVINVPSFAIEDSLVCGSYTKQLGFQHYTD